MKSNYIFVLCFLCLFLVYACNKAPRLIEKTQEELPVQTTKPESKAKTTETESASNSEYVILPTNKNKLKKLALTSVRYPNRVAKMQPDRLKRVDTDSVPLSSVVKVQKGLQVLEYALKNCKKSKGTYPEKLSDMLKAEGADKPCLPGIPRDPWKRPYTYKKISDNEFLLFSNGPDGFPETLDDIYLNDSEKQNHELSKQP